MYRLIRLTSPRLNYLIIIGAILMYISIIIYSIPATTQLTATVFCNVSAPILL